jgi:benzoyl-CoA reductase/2-hydroxyglutaryl-CoA dehydratase subunit BcrC/BadD/HgdB
MLPIAWRTFCATIIPHFGIRITNHVSRTPAYPASLGTAQVHHEVTVPTLPVIPRRSEIIVWHKERGGHIAAVTPIHYPRALLRVFDILPVEVWGPPQVDASYGAAHLQPYVCSIVRNALAFQQMGGLDVADVIVVPHACDSLQGLGSLLIDFIRPRQPVIPLYLPRGRRASDVEFFANELRSVYRQLEQITGQSPSNAELMAGIQREEAADELLAQLHQQRKHLPLTDAQLYRLIRAREYLPAEVFARLAHTALAQAASPTDESAGYAATPDKSGWESDRYSPLDGALLRRRADSLDEKPAPESDTSLSHATERASRRGIPVILSGIVPEPMSLFESLAEMGGLVVADDFACCGRRLYPRGTSDDPFHWMAESILGAPPDSTRGHPIQERLDHLVRLVKTAEAKGIVFYNAKFCEPELFDLPILRKGLQETGIPTTTVEVDIGDPLSHQTLTRLEAFLEMIGHRG